LALVTIADYKTYAGISGTSQDTRLTLLVSLVDDWFNKLTGKTLGSSTLTEFYDGNGTATLNLNTYPVASITSIEYRDDEGTYSTVDATSYRFEAGTGIVTLLGSQPVLAYTDPVNRLPRTSLVWSSAWTPGFQNYRVIYVAGYSSVPASLQYAAFLAMDMMLANAGQSGMFNAESIGQYSYNRATKDEQLKGIMDILGDYVSLAV
jgi:hypothetical protein